MRRLGLVFAGVIGLAVLQPRVAEAATPAPTVAPYVDMVGSNPELLDQALAGKLGDFTAGFVLGKGCAPVWDDETTSATAADNAINNRIDAASHGGKPVVPIVSFGGQGGFDLAITCTTQSKLTAAYQSVIDRYALTRVDFDVEGASLDDSQFHDSIVRRFKSIKALVAANPGLQVSYTLPSDYYGLATPGTSFLSASKTAGVRPAIVNIMAMEFSDPPPGSPAAASQGAATINAAQQALTQVKAVWSNSTYANIGITPMAGQNINGDVLSLADAADVNEWARKEAHIGRLAFWSINRDRACNPASESLSACSKVSQSPLDFTNAFLVAPK